VTQCSLVARFGGTAAFHLQNTTKVVHEIGDKTLLHPTRQEH
jgi:hypothetical protein